MVSPTNKSNFDRMNPDRRTQSPERVKDFDDLLSKAFAHARYSNDSSLASRSTASSSGSTASSLGERKISVPNSYQNYERKGFPLLATDSEALRRFSVVKRRFARYEDPHPPTAFFDKMPIGADTHAHNTASFDSPEVILSWAIKLGLYIHKKNFDVVKAKEHTIIANLRKKGYIPAHELKEDESLKKKYFASLTMKGQHPWNLEGGARFFNACKAGEQVVGSVPLHERVSEIAISALYQKILYREDMVEILLENDKRATLKADVFGALEFQCDSIDSYLKHSTFKKMADSYCSEVKKQLDKINNQVPLSLNSYAKKNAKKLGIPLEDVDEIFDSKISLNSVRSPFTYRILLEISKTQGLEDFFIDAALAMIAAERFPDWIVGTNVVGEENHPISMNLFDQQLLILKKLRDIHSNVKFSIHIGELSFEHRVEEDKLKGRIREVINLKPDRIGHAFTFQHESKDEQKALLDLIKKKGIFIEVCPTSSLHILKEFPHWFTNNIQDLTCHFTINTDDGLINGSNISSEYVQVWDKGFKLDTEGNKVKFPLHRFLQWNRNSLESAFLPGKSLYVVDKETGYFVLRDEFQNFPDLSDEAREILKQSEKATLQYRLETELMKFFDDQYEEEMKARCGSPVVASQSPIAIPQNTEATSTDDAASPPK